MYISHVKTEKDEALSIEFLLSGLLDVCWKGLGNTGEKVGSRCSIII